jgi:hypothetical protein
VERDEKLAALRLTLKGDGWTQVMWPRLASELVAARLRLEGAPAEDAVRIAQIQAEIRLLRALTEQPREYFEPVEAD